MTLWCSGKSGVDDFDKLNILSPMEIGRWLHADARSMAT
jgi:hypothetical protein